MEKPKFRKGQLLTNINTGKEIFVDNALIDRKVVNNHTGFVDEFNGEYSYSWYENGKKLNGEISEEVLIKYYE